MKQKNIFLTTLCLTVLLALAGMNTQAQSTLKIEQPPVGSNDVFLNNVNGNNTIFQMQGVEKMRLMDNGRLQLNGSLIFNEATNPILYLGADGAFSQRYLQLIVSPVLTGAAGIKVGGLVVANSYAAYDPPPGNAFVQNYLQIGTDASANELTRLQVHGDAMKSGGGAWSEISDRLLKKDIQAFSDGLQTVLSIKPKTYKYNGKGGTPSNSKQRIGIIAQDIEQVAPYMVSEFYRKLNQDDATETRLLMYNSSALPYILVNAIKELNTKIEANKTLGGENATLKSEVDTLKKENADLKTKLADLELRLKSIEETLKNK